MKSSHLRMLLLLGALGLACSPESAFSQEKAAAQAYAGKTVTGEVTVKQTVEDTLQSHRGLKVMQENLDVVRHELRRAKAGWGPSVDAVGRTGASRLSNTTTRPLNADKDMYGANSISLTLTQPLWDGFATRSRVRTGEATVDSMTYRVLDNATSFALDAIIAHVDLLRRREIDPPPPRGGEDGGRGGCIGKVPGCRKMVFHRFQARVDGKTHTAHGPFLFKSGKW